MSTGDHCGIYVRISEDRSGEALGVARQEQDCRELAARLGWTVTRVYKENDMGAFKRRKVTLPDGSTGMRVIREAFRQMLSDAEVGSINAIIGYDLDRVARDPRDLEDLVDLKEVRNIEVRSVTGSLRLDDDAGITMARVMVAVANKSSRDTSRRVIRKHQELAEAGKPGGGGHRSYGYTRDMQIVPEEAAIVREIANRIVFDAHSILAIATDLTDRRVPTTRQILNVRGEPRPWCPRSVHAVVTKAAVAGLRSHKGEIVGPATWPAILDQETWETVCMRLDERAQGHDNRLKRWLNTVLICARCGVPMGSTNGNAGPRYWCAPGARSIGGCGKLTVNARVEVVIRGFVIGYLSRPDVASVLHSATSGASADDARAAMQEDQEQMRELAEMWARKDISTKEYMPARNIIEKRLQGYKEVLRQTLPSSIRKILTQDDIGLAFDTLSPHDRRRVVQFLLPGGIYVLPARTRGRFEAGRVLPAFGVRDQAHLEQITADWLAGVDPVWPLAPQAA